MVPSWISDQKDFLSTSHPDASYLVRLDFGSGEEAINRFPRWPPWHSAIFNLQVTLSLPTKFQVNLPFQVNFDLLVNRPFGSGVEVKNRFSRFFKMAAISDQNYFSYF